MIIDGEGDGNRVAFTVEFIEELGAGRLAHGTLEGSDFIVQLPSGVQMAPGVAHTLTLAPAALHLFNTATGQRCQFSENAQPAGMDIEQIGRAHV